MNVAVINIKDILKYFMKFVSVFLIVFGLAKCAKINRNNKEIQEDINFKEYSLLECIEYSVSFFHNSKKKENKTFTVAALELSLGQFNINNREKEQNENIEESVVTTNAETEQKDTITIGTNVNTEKVEEKNIPTTYTNNYSTVEIKNGTNYELTEDILYPNPDITNKKNILIFHTHTCESYTPSDNYNYEMTGNYRTTDLNYSVARVGTELKKSLDAKGFMVTHNTTYHDYPSYSGSYSRSLETVSNILQNNPAQIVFDIHRDAVGSLEDYGPTVKIDGQYVAQLMFVIGTDAGGLEHPNWRQNLKFAIKIQETANEMYPGLFRPISLTNSRYNQHTAPGASIIEVGATGNTLEQCLLSMQCLANVLEKALE
ncbi:MAG: stage II sporulation protein P [Clostridia bacterium]|nr:stage II sporulation protein P [Clostridia bacterium]